MPSLPTSLALASIADGSSIVAADHRNNYSAIQTDVNSLITALGAGAAGQFLAGNGSTLSWLQPPGTELNYTEFTAAVTVSAASAATANTVVTAGAVTFDGATIAEVEFQTYRVDTAAAAGAVVEVTLWDGATDLGTLGSFLTPAAAAAGAPMSRKRRLTPSAGSHTFSVRAWQVGGNGTIRAGTGGVGTQLPGYIKVTKV